METSTIRSLAAAGAAALGVLAALLMGAPFTAALVAVAAGVLASTLVPRTQPPKLEAAATEEPLGPASLPSIPSLIDAVEEPVLLVREGRVMLANAAARETLGAHIEGGDVRLAIRHPAAAERLAASDEESERSSRTLLIGLGEPGRRWEMSTSHTDDGSILVRLEDRSAAYAADQMRTDFVANASHELRTPLATLLGFLETLEDEETPSDPGTRGRFLKIMGREAMRMRQLVDDLLSLSRVEADRFAAPREPVDLAAVLREVQAALAALAEERGSSIEVEIGAERAVIAGDRPQLVQMLHNLVENALKYGRPGTPVRVRLFEEGQSGLRLTIADEGEGIPPDHLPRLTERFYRVDPGRSRAVGGTGLGLAIVKHIVDRHRGRMDIASTRGRGTTVELRLPRLPEPLS